jgi:FkbM family methyltransferase
MVKIAIFFNKVLKKIMQYISFEAYEIRRIKKIPRYLTGRTKIFGFDFVFIDSASFAGQYEEIFNKKIYNFQTENQQPYIIDCGSNVGVSILFFKKTYPKANIIAFEPDKKIFLVLKQNIEKSNCKEITLINKGLWNKEGETFFYEEGADGGSIVNGNTDHQAEKKYLKVETTSLRPYLTKEVDFLKIDIEGAESTVLEDCDELLINVHRIFIEFHSRINNEQRLDSILSILTKNGFRYYMQSDIIFNTEPFIQRASINFYDNLINIYAYRNPETTYQKK